MVVDSVGFVSYKLAGNRTLGQSECARSIGRVGEGNAGGVVGGWVVWGYVHGDGERWKEGG